MAFIELRIRVLKNKFIHFFLELKEKADFILFLHKRLTFNEHEQKSVARFPCCLFFFNIEKREVPELGWSV